MGLVDEVVGTAVNWAMGWSGWFCWFGSRRVKRGMDIEESSELKELEDVEELGLAVEWFGMSFGVWRFGDDAQNFFLKSVQRLKVGCVGLS